MTKKEVQMLNRERIKLADQHRGIKDMKRLPDVIVIVDGHYESTAIKEAKRLEIPIIAIIDSNTDPNIVSYPIPANDDSIRTIQLIIGAIADEVIAVREGTNEVVEEPSKNGESVGDKGEATSKITESKSEKLAEASEAKADKPDNSEETPAEESPSTDEVIEATPAVESTDKEKPETS